MTIKAKAAHAAMMVGALTKHHLRRIRYGDYAFFKVLHDSPLMVLLVHHLRDLSPLHQAAKENPAYFFFNLWGTIESPKSIRAIVQYDRKKNRRFPHHQYIFLCNALEEQRLLREEGIEAVWCNHNAWIDENIFRLTPEVEKRFDAVYDANLSPYKRHALAADIENLALISFRHPVMFNRIYAEMIHRKLDHAHWANDPLSAEFRYLSNDEVVAILNQSRVGLCLSAMEGAMFASIQYLLCGLPVVTTPSKGGRDTFFEEEYVLTVEPEPGAVGRGVADLIARNLSPKFIRNKTLEKMRQHRQTFIDLLQQIFDRHDPSLNARSVWENMFTHKMGLKHQALRQGAEEIRKRVPLQRPQA